MKIGLISDIHADLKALNKALRLLKNRHAVDSIWCAGDLVGRGSDPNDVVARIVENHIPAVLGNHDEFALRLRQTRPEKSGEMLNYSPATFQRLATLPRTYRTRYSGRSVVMVHGTPRSNMEAMRLTPASRSTSLNWLGKIGATILITGHTHVPMMAQSPTGLIVNPGSLFDPSGGSRSSSETYGVLDVTAMQFSHYPLWD